MSSLREDLKKIDKMTTTRIMREPTAEDSFIVDMRSRLDDAVVDEILATLQTAVLAAAPEKVTPEPHVEQKPDDYVAYRGMIGGYNEAINDYTKALQQLFESEG